MSVRTPPSLVSSLVKAAALWAVPGLILTAVVLTLLSHTSTYRSFDEPLESAILGVIASVESSDGRNLRLSRELPDPRYQRALSGKYWAIGTIQNGSEIVPILSSRSLYGSSLPIRSSTIAKLALQEQEPVRFATPGPDIDAGETLRVVARQVVLPEMENSVIVLAAADRAQVIRSTRNFILTAVTLLVLLTLGLTLAVYAQVRLGLKPLFELGRRIAEVREGQAVSVEGEYPPEIAPLAMELNSLISHNKSVVERAQTHVGNLAHALKTPIAVLRNEAAGTKTTPSDIVARQTEMMAEQVDHHLRRARAAARGQAIGVRTEMDPVIDGLARTLPRIYRDKDLRIERSGPTGLIFRGHPRDFEDMVGNLMDNAAKWTTDRIDIAIQTDDTGFCTVVISDNGPGLTVDEGKIAIQRGARLDEATPGSGLGLSIVDDLANAYKGDFTLSRSTLGGLAATLRLPVVKEL